VSSLAILLLIAFGLNFRWVHAASVAATSERCPAELVSHAQHSVADLFGSTKSSPIIRCVSGPSLGLTVDYGSTNFAPALPPVIIVGPQGQNPDVVAHEWAHAEIFERLSFMAREFWLPTWVDEGLAMQVDHRDPYNVESLRVLHGRDDLTRPSIASMKASGFFIAGDQGRYHYAYAKCLVNEGISRHDGWLGRLERTDDEALSVLQTVEVHCR